MLYGKIESMRLKDTNKRLKSTTRKRKFPDTPTTPRLDFVIWLAGFFDGEGCLYLTRRKGNKNPVACLGISQSGKNGLKVLREIKSCLGTGTIYIRLRGQDAPFKENKPSWEIRIHRRRDLIFLLNLLIPFLRIKREKAIAVCKILINMGTTPNMLHWTEAEERTLVKYYPTCAGDELLHSLPNRSLSAIANRARRLRLRKI